VETIAIREWVEQSPDYRPLRQAVHTILTAIAGTPDLQSSMVMKGGVLLALRYRSQRHTRDIDFSTSVPLQDFDLDAFRATLEQTLIGAVERLGYGLDCRIQRCKQSPPRADATFPTIQVTLGYAYKDDRNAHKRLLAGRVPTTIRLDYSLNEPVGETDLFELEAGSVIRTYSLVELVAEKLRALLQQEVRNRVRRQDIYDLHYLLSDHPLRDDPPTRASVLERLVAKARARDLEVGPDAMGNPEIIRRSRAEYKTLASEIEGDLPDFDAVYRFVEAFYRSLPWRPG
jgi:hypothetical protein